MGPSLISIALWAGNGAEWREVSLGSMHSW